MKNFFLILFSIISFKMNSQDILPFKEIGPYPEKFSSNNVISRMIEGLGFRYYWATESLTRKDLNHKPSQDSRSSLEIIEHIYSLSNFILFTLQKKEYELDVKKMNFDELRRKTLNNYKIIYEILKNEKGLSKLKIRIRRNDKVQTFPFWNIINGPISDSIWHVGQVVSHRRASGNPINPKVNVFLGKIMD